MENDQKMIIDNKHIRNRQLIFTCPVFKLFQAEKISHRSNSHLIYDLKLSFIDHENELIRNNDSFTSILKNKSKSFMDRVGYSYNKQENDLHLYYMKENYKMFELDKFIQNINEVFKQFAISESTDEINHKKLIKMQFFYDVLQIVFDANQNQNKISLFHPNLIFYNNDVKYCDNIFKDIIENVDMIKYSPICKYFGYSNIDIIEMIVNNEYEDSDKIFDKTDVVLITVFLIHLFSTVIIDNRENNYENTFDQILIDLQNEYFKKETSENQATPNKVKTSSILKNINDNEIKEFIHKIGINNLKDIKTILEFKNEYEKIYYELMDEVKCFECNSGPNFKKRVFYNCFHIVCSNCNNKHNCSLKSVETTDYEFENYNFQIERLGEISKLIPSLENKNIIEYFNPVKEAMKEINTEQDKIELLIKLEEEKINNLISFIEKILNQRNSEFFNELNAGMEMYRSLVKQLEKRNSLTIDYSQTPIHRDISEEIDQQIENYKMFILDTKNFKDTINNDVRILNTINMFEKQSDIYIKEVENCFQNEFIEALKNCSDIINDLIKLDLFNKNKFHAELHKPIDNINVQFIGTIDSNLDEANNKNYIYVFDTNLQDAPIRKPINFLGDKIKNCYQHHRWINLGHRLFVTGGICIKDSTLQTISKSYLINFNTNNSHSQIEILCDMNFSRDQHMIAKIDELNIIVMGGFNTTTCEVYNFLTDSWHNLPHLNLCRYDSGVFINSKSEIYVCFGFKGDKNFQRTIKNDYEISISGLSSIEKLNFNSKDQKWELINIDYNYNISLFGIIPCSDDKIYILGGKNEDLSLSDKTYSLCLNSFKLANEVDKLLKNKIAMYESTFFKSGDGWAQYDINLCLTIIKNFS